MTERDAPATGAWQAGPAGDGADGAPGAGKGGAEAADAGRRRDAHDEVERLTARRDSARWSAVVGFGLLFAASFSTAFLFGGVGMIAYGVVASMYWSTRLRAAKGDPWAYDPDLDGPHAPAWSRTGQPPAQGPDAEAEAHHEDGHADAGPGEGSGHGGGDGTRESGRQP